MMSWSLLYTPNIPGALVLANCTLKTTMRIIILEKIPTQSPDTKNIMENKQFPYK